MSPDRRPTQPTPDPRPLAPSHVAVLEELRRAALATYGEERSADASLRTALNLAATAVWRVSEEPLELLGNEPLPTHD